MGCLPVLIDLLRLVDDRTIASAAERFGGLLAVISLPSAVQHTAVFEVG